MFIDFIFSLVTYILRNFLGSMRWCRWQSERARKALESGKLNFLSSTRWKWAISAISIELFSLSANIAYAVDVVSGWEEREVENTCWKFRRRRSFLAARGSRLTLLIAAESDAHATKMKKFPHNRISNYVFSLFVGERKREKKFEEKRIGARSLWLNILIGFHQNFRPSSFSHLEDGCRTRPINLWFSSQRPGALDLLINLKF